MGSTISSAPPAFQEALRSLGRARVRPDIALTETPAPSRIAPFAVAIDGEVTAANTEASGRLVVLHDPATPETWDGDFRVIVLVKAQVEPEVGTDDLLADVAWTWLTDQLAEVDHHALGGSVTTVVSQSFGELDERPKEVTVEMRASWTPGSPDMGPHVHAWANLMATCAGIPPVPDGVTVLPGRTL